MGGRKKNKFIDDKASVGYSSEEEIETGEVNRQAANDMMEKLIEQRRSNMNALNERLNYYLKMDNLGNSDSSVFESDTSDAFELPKLCDPKIWRVKCTRGQELELIFQIVRKPQQRVVSVFHNPKIRGAIFIEAYYDYEVKQCLQDLVYPIIDYIEPKDCLDVLDTRQNVNLEYGQWVRIKNHPIYSNDLAKVMKINQVTQRVTVKLIPRIKTTQGTQKQPLTCNLGSGQQDIVDGYQIFMESSFIYDDIIKERKCALLDGFALVTIKSKNILTNIQLNEEELQLFYPDIKDPRILVQQAKRELMQRVEVQFKVGDRVRLFQDTDQSPEFTVSNRYDDDMLELLAQNKGKEYTYLVHASEVKRAYQKYQQVSVIDGPYRGYSGIIVEIKANNVLLSCDSVMIRVPHSVLSIEMAKVHTNYDLVKYGSNDIDIGCALKTKSGSMTILTLSNQLTEISLMDVKIINNANSIEYNRFNQSIGKKDNVIVMDGQYKNKKGVVLHCINQKLYIYNQIFPNTVIIECVNNVRLLINDNGNMVRQQDQIIGQTITINSGTWKGYRGLVVKVRNQNIFVQLHARSITVQVPYQWEQQQQY